MMKLIPATRAIVFAAGLVLATMSGAAAEEAEAPKEAEPFKPTMYFGPTFGYADQDSSKYGWTIKALARPIENLGIQIEYLNLGKAENGPGDHDGAYFGVAPILPVGSGVDLYAQLGFAVGDPGDDVAAGLGVMYSLPIEMLASTGVVVELMADYKYLNWDSGDHLLTFGFLFGFFKR